MPSAHLSEQHRTKRPFQPAITSYFHAAQGFSDNDDSSGADDNDDDDNSQYSRGGPRLRTIPQPRPHHPTLAPQLPDHIQSSLLSVGMRVRKSVPEGYKTPKPLSLTPSLHQPTVVSSTPLRKPHSAFRDTHPTLEIPVDSLAATLQHQRELLPFCGLNKIGGYAEQPTPHLFGVGTTTSAPQTFSQPFSSQDSGYGTDVVRPAGKRGWSHDDEGEAEDGEDGHPGSHSLRAGAAAGMRNNNFLFTIPAKISGEEDVPVSPLSASPPPSSNFPPQRAFAQPKSRRRRPQRDEEMMEYDTAAHEGRLAAGCASDFEEADFLAEHEVTMGGV